MKRLFYLVLSLLVFAGCHKDDDDSNPVITELVGDISFDMVYVKAG